MLSFHFLVLVQSQRYCKKKIFVSALALMPNFDVVTLNSGNVSSGTSRVSIYCLPVASFFIKSIFYKYTFTQNRFFHII